MNPGQHDEPFEHNVTIAGDDDKPASLTSARLSSGGDTIMNSVTVLAISVITVIMTSH